jgi:hypothetical protein
MDGEGGANGAEREGHAHVQVQLSARGAQLEGE